MKKLKDFLVGHDYYCSESNYYSNEAAQYFASWKDFYAEFKDADIDLNLVFRFDIKFSDESKKYFAQVFIIQQRKGIFTPVSIEKIEEDDVETLTTFLQAHYQKLVSLWQPISMLS